MIDIQQIIDRLTTKNAPRMGSGGRYLYMMSTPYGALAVDVQTMSLVLVDENITADPDPAGVTVSISGSTLQVRGITASSRIDMTIDTDAGPLTMQDTLTGDADIPLPVGGAVRVRIARAGQRDLIWHGTAA